MSGVKIKEVYPHINNEIAIFYGLGDDGKIYAWNPTTHKWEVFKQS